MGDFSCYFPVAEEDVLIYRRLNELHSSLRIGERAVYRSEACSRYNYVGLGSQFSHMRITYSQEFQSFGVYLSVFSEYNEGFYTVKSFFACGDSHVNEALRIVLGLDLEDTVSRRTDMAGKHGDIGDENCTVRRQEVLLINYHSFLGGQILVSYGLGFAAYLDGSK